MASGSQEDLYQSFKESDSNDRAIAIGVEKVAELVGDAIELMMSANSDTAMNAIEVDPSSHFTHEHNPWITALKENDVETVRAMLHEADEKQTRILLTGWIDTNAFWDSCEGKRTLNKKLFSIRRSFTLAAVCGSVKVLEELVKHGIDVCQVDSLGNNAVHTLIIYASQSPELEESLLRIYKHIKSLVHKEKMEELILNENSHGLLPLELAGALQTLRFAKAIMETKGHYRMNCKYSGLMRIDEYNVDDYEGVKGSRPVYKSPTFMLVNLGNDKLDEPFTREFFYKGVFDEWLHSRRDAYKWIVLLWFIFRVIFTLLALSVTTLTIPTRVLEDVCGYLPNIHPSTRQGFIIVLLVTSLLCMGSVIWDVAYMRRATPPGYEMYDFNKGGNVVRYWKYRSMQAFLHICVVILASNRLAIEHGRNGMPLYLTELVVVIFTVCMIWSFLFFAQLTQTFCKYVTAIQHMTNDVFRFGALIAVFVIPFSLLYPQFIQRDENGTCPAEFSDTVSTLYFGFKMSQKMFDPDIFPAPSQEGVWLLHMICVVLVTILLFSFLISVFSDSYKIVAENPDIMYDINWLSVMAVIDIRFSCVAASLMDKLKMKYFHTDNYTNKLTVKTFKTKKLKFNH